MRTLNLFVFMVIIASVTITLGCQGDINKKTIIQSSPITLDVHSSQMQWSLSKTPKHWRVSITPSSKINEYNIDFDYLGESEASNPSLTFKGGFTASTRLIQPHTRGFTINNVHFQDKKITHEYILKWVQDKTEYEETAIVNITTQ